MYEVIVLFEDLKDKNYQYNVGDTYPREGLKPSKARIAELSGADNKRNMALIKPVPKDANITE